MSRSVRRQLRILALVAAIAEQLGPHEAAARQRLNDLVEQTRNETLSVRSQGCSQRVYARELQQLQQRVHAVYATQHSISALELINAALQLVADVATLVAPNQSRKQRAKLWAELETALQDLIETRDPELCAPEIASGSRVAPLLEPETVC